MSMATKTTTTLSDDLDGSTAERTVTYTWQGQAYEIDLNSKNAEAFADAVAPYLAASRKASRSSGRGSGRRASAAPKTAASTGSAAPSGVGEFDPKEVRAWAKANGIEISPRGRLSSGVLHQYRDAQ